MKSFELIESVADLVSLEQGWRELQERAPHTPFQDYSWQLAWWKHLGGLLGQQPRLMTVRDGSNLKLILPMSLSKDGATLEWSSAGVSDYCDALVAPEDVPLILEAVARLLSLQGVKRMKLTQLRNDSLAYSQMGLMRNCLAREDAACPLIPVSPHGFEAWKVTADRKEMAEAGRRRRRLSEAGEISMIQAATPEEIHSAVSKLISDKRLWLERRGSRNYMCSEAGIDFLSNALGAMNRSGMVHVTSLLCGDTPIANQIAFTHAKRYYYYFGSWDFAWKSYAPGKLHMLDLVQYAHENGFKEFDMLRGAEEYKDKFASETNLLNCFEIEMKRPQSLARRVLNTLKSRLLMSR